jgi:uncharacterized beta-barrel protein YwiB (DUF1934 family)
MKKIHIKSKISSDVEEESFIDTYGEYNEEENTITYIDKSINVCVIIGEKIIFERKSDNYNIKLIFEEGKINSTIYQIYDPKMAINLDTETKVLSKEQNRFHIEYKLSNNREEIGNFSIDFEWEE